VKGGHARTPAHRRGDARALGGLCLAVGGRGAGDHRAQGLAYRLTGSVGLLSDALESFVNLAAAIVALTMIHVAARPPDEEHAYGYSKAEYFASGFEGALIFLAAAIGVAAGSGCRPVPLGCSTSVWRSRRAPRC
jgi:hypothetical protein